MIGGRQSEAAFGRGMEVSRSGGDDQPGSAKPLRTSDLELASTGRGPHAGRKRRAEDLIGPSQRDPRSLPRLR